MQGSISLEDLSESLGTEFTSEDAETLGGLVLTMSGGFPEVGETFEYEGWSIEVRELEEHRITLLKLSRVEQERSSEE